MTLIGNSINIAGMNQTLLVASWFSTTFISLILSLFLLVYISNEQIVLATPNTYRLYQALPQTQSEITDTIQVQDGRVKIVEDFFSDYNSNLKPHAQTFIDVADKHHIDYRLLPAIAMQESNGGKKMPKDSFNPFGFGIYGSKILKFESFDEAIEVVGESLRVDYIDQGLKTPFEIMSKYTPPSLSKGNAWAKGVSSFMEELR